jgi:hypothetical protein
MLKLQGKAHGHPQADLGGILIAAEIQTCFGREGLGADGTEGDVNKRPREGI